MRLLVRVAVPAILVLTSTVASAADPCALLSKGDAAALLGEPVAAVVPAGPQRDEDSGGQLSYCSYRGASAAVVVSVVEFTSEPEAREQLSINLLRERMDEEDATVTEEPGLGDRAFFGASANGSMYAFSKKNKVVGIALGGAKTSASAVSKSQLKSSALAIAAKL